MTNFEKLMDEINAAAECAADTAESTWRRAASDMFEAGADAADQDTSMSDAYAEILAEYVRNYNSQVSAMHSDLVKDINKALAKYQAAILSDCEKVVLDAALRLAIQIIPKVTELSKQGKSYEEAAVDVAAVALEHAPEIREKLEEVIC